MQNEKIKIEPNKAKTFMDFYKLGEELALKAWGGLPK